MSRNVWSRPEACVAAASVFQLANELPLLRPDPDAAINEAAAALEPGTRTVPRPIVEDLMASLGDVEVARLARLVDAVAPERWRTLVAEVGEQPATEPLLVGAISAAVVELVPPPCWFASMRETTADAAPGPLNVLATLIPPESVWSLETAREAEALVSDPRALFAFAKARASSHGSSSEFVALPLPWRESCRSTTRRGRPAT